MARTYPRLRGSATIGTYCSPFNNHEEDRKKHLGGDSVPHRIKYKKLAR